MLNKDDLLIIKTIEQYGEFEVKKVGNIEIEYIHKLGIHKLKYGIPIIYDRGALKHFLITRNDSSKTKRLTPSQTVEIIYKPKIILPNFTRGSNNSYLYVGKLENVAISIVEVLLDENKIRITHGGFEVKDKAYLKKAKELRDTILEGWLWE